MITTEQIRTLMTDGGTVVGDDGNKIGKIGQVFLDDATGKPEWVTVKTGLFGTSESFVPLAQGNATGDELRVPFGKDKVKDAPRMDDDGGHLSEQQEDELYSYYGLAYSDSHSDNVNRDTSGPTTGTVGRDTSGPTTDDAMTRSEEQVHVGTESRQTGKARLRKYVTTEHVTQTVPVKHEEVRLEREPITDANRGAATSGGGITEEEHEVTLTEERPVVTKESVPVERVRMDKETVTDSERVDADVRKENIETDGADTARGNR